MKIKNLRWAVVTLVAIATVINYVDRNALGVMWPQISEDLGMDKNDYALVLSFFMVGYAIGQTLFGKVFDMIGTQARLRAGDHRLVGLDHAARRGAKRRGARRRPFRPRGWRSRQLAGCHEEQR